MEAIADIIQCSICLETFTDPRMLPCIHTFCLKCLQQIVSKMDDTQSKDKIHCPICRLEFTIPPQGVEAFQKNFFMLKLKDIGLKTTTKPLDKSCDLCLESKERDQDEVLQAEIYCKECCKNICKKCIKCHNSNGELKEHQFIPLVAEILEDIHEAFSHEKCSKHKNEKVKLYCSDCKEVICVDCLAENHQNHKCSGVEQVGGAFRQQLIDATREIDTCLNESMKKVQRCTVDRTNFQQNVGNIEEKIISRRNELIAMIDKSAQSLLDELTSIRQTRLKEVQSEIDENERQVVILESFKAYCNQIESKGSSMELCQVFPTLKRRAEDLQLTQQTICRRSTELLQVQFEQTNLEEISKSENTVGRVKVVPGFIRSSVKLDIPSSSFVFGVTKLENKICVLCRIPNVLRIFNDQDLFELQMQIELKQIKEPHDIASCEKSKCLYVKEAENTCIWKITTEDIQVTKWLNPEAQTSLFRRLVDIGLNPFGEIAEQAKVSVSNNGNLLLSRFIYGQGNSLEIYNSDAKLIHKFRLPSIVCCPQHVIRKPNGEFIIIHREGPYDAPWVISRLTSDGQRIVGNFSPTSKTKQFNTPRHLALDSDNNRLFVADCGNDRVIILDSHSLTLQQILLTEKDNGITSPCELFYDGKKKQLIIGHSSNKVDVYDIT